jgi:peptide/nickel transport system ATP-binding protein
MRRIRGRKIGAIFQDPLTSLNPLYSVGRQITETMPDASAGQRIEARRRAIDLLKSTGIQAAGAADRPLSAPVLRAGCASAW